MSVDKQLPLIFSKIDEHGNLYNSIIVCGIICSLIALLIPFTYLDDMISAGVLVSFNLTNSSLIIIRRSTEEKQSLLKCQKYVGLYNIFIAIFSYFFIELIETSNDSFNIYFGFIISLLFCLYFVYNIFGLPECDDSSNEVQFRVPFVPLLPLFGIMINYMLIAQLSQRGIFMVVGYFGFAVSFYFANGFNRLFRTKKNISIDLQLSSSMSMNNSSRSKPDDEIENLHANLLSSVMNNNIDNNNDNNNRL
jgi:amino acid transporter